MQHEVNLNISLTLEAPSDMTREQVEGEAYWLLQPFIEQFVGDHISFCNLKSFDIEIKNEN